MCVPCGRYRLVERVVDLRTRREKVFEMVQVLVPRVKLSSPEVQRRWNLSWLVGPSGVITPFFIGSFFELRSTAS